MNWVVLKINFEGNVEHKLLRGYSGGYLDGDSWQLNSGIVKVEDMGKYYSVYGHSGSAYDVGKLNERTSFAMAPVLATLGDLATVITMEDYLANNRDED